MQENTDNHYAFSAPENWTKSLSDQEILQTVTDSDFFKEPLREGKDVCYYLHRLVRTTHESVENYVCMVYTLHETANFEAASVKEYILEESETLFIHRLSVIRNGELIDKMKDMDVKVLDHEDGSGNGVFNKLKKVNISVKDLRIGDILVQEDTRKMNYTDRDFMRKEYFKYVYSSPDSYWSYGHFEFTFINDRNQDISYKRCYFKDGKTPENNVLKPCETFSIVEKNYNNLVDKDREVYPFIDFASAANWETLSSFIAPYYEDELQRFSLQEIAPDFWKSLHQITDKEQQIRYAIEYVQNHIKYIFDVNIMNGHRPQDAKTTFENKQGDCKAKSLLLKVILDEINVDSDIVLVNYRSDVFVNDYLPSLFSFNHVILKVNHLDEEYFVDATLRDDCGTLENRGRVSFLNYLPIKNQQTLLKRKAFSYANFAIEDTTTYTAKNNLGTLEITTIYRYGRANSIRRYFRNTSKMEAKDSWLKFIFNSMNFNNDRSSEDVRTLFQDVTLDVIRDDENLNEIVVKFSTTFDNPYFVNADRQRFMMFFDYNIPKNAVRDFKHKDFPFWQSFDTEKYTITIETDQKIDTQEKYTVKECDIKNRYFTHSIKKNIHKNGGTAVVEFRPLSNLEIPDEAMIQLKKDYAIVADSNFGLGIDIIESGMMNQLKHKWKSIF